MTRSPTASTATMTAATRHPGTGNEGQCILDPSAMTATIGVRVMDDDNGRATDTVTVSQQAAFCVSRYTGAMREPLAGETCSTGSITLTLPAEDSVILCINPYTGQLELVATRRVCRRPAYACEPGRWPPVLLPQPLDWSAPRSAHTRSVHCPRNAGCYPRLDFNQIEFGTISKVFTPCVVYSDHSAALHSSRAWRSPSRSNWSLQLALSATARPVAAPKPRSIRPSPAAGWSLSNCGPAPYTIPLTTEKSLSVNTQIDGGALITLDGQHQIPHLLRAERRDIRPEQYHVDAGNGEGTGTPTGAAQSRIDGGSATITNSLLTANSVGEYDDGGAIDVRASGGELTVIASTLTNNVGGAASNLRRRRLHHGDRQRHRRQYIR